MSERMKLNDVEVDKVVGGALSYKWRNSTKGQVGINGNYTHKFTDKDAFESHVSKCHSKGMKDTEILDSLIAAGIVW